MNPSPGQDQIRETASFIVRSEHRVNVLNALASEPLTRDELREATDVPRVSLGRVLTAFEDRGWIKRTGQYFTTTLAGDALAEALDSFLRMIEVVQKVEKVIEWLPADELPFDLTCLADAEIIVPGDGDPMVPVRQAREWIAEAERVRVLSPVVISETLESNWEAVTRRGQTFEGVFPSSVIDTIADDSTMALQLREMIESGRADVYHCDCDVPYVISTTEDVAALPLSDEQGMPRGLIVTDDADVYAWADGVIDRYRDCGRQVGPDRFRS